MISPCLSATGIRFLTLPVPAGGLYLPYSRLTVTFGGPHRGFRVPHEGDATGVGVLFTPGPVVFMTEFMKDSVYLGHTSPGSLLSIIIVSARFR